MNIVYEMDILVVRNALNHIIELQSRKESKDELAKSIIAIEERIMIEEFYLKNVNGMFKEICRDICKATMEIAAFGIDQARRFEDAINSKIQVFLENHKDKARKKLLDLKVGIAQTCAEIYDQALQLCPPTVDISGKQLSATTVSITYEFSLSSGIEASLTHLFKLVAEGKIQVKADYS